LPSGCVQALGMRGPKVSGSEGRESPWMLPESPPCVPSGIPGARSAAGRQALAKGPRSGPSTACQRALCPQLTDSAKVVSTVLGAGLLEDAERSPKSLSGWEPPWSLSLQQSRQSELVARIPWCLEGRVGGRIGWYSTGRRLMRPNLNP
jgi:hypothetical protein